MDGRIERRAQGVNPELARGRKLVMIEEALDLDDLRIPPSNHLEKLKGNLKGYHSIRINKQYRVVFRWANSAAHEVLVVDDH